MEKFYYTMTLICFLPLIYLSLEDIKKQQISRNITLFTVFFALSFHSLTLILYEYEPSYQALLGGLVLGVPFLACVLLTKEKALGMGDVYLFILMGILVGLENIYLSLSIMVFTALTFSLFKYKKLSLKQKIPLVPFITLGIFLSVLLNLF